MRVIVTFASAKKQNQKSTTMNTSRFKHMLLAAAAALLATSASAQMMPQVDPDTKYATEVVAAGTTAPNFKMNTIDGETFELSSLKGQWVVLDFWASWCPDCRAEAPAVARMAREFGPLGVKFVGVSMDTDPKAWRAAVEKYGMDYTHVSELKKFKQTDIHRAYGVNWIPTMVVIDPQGKVALSTVCTYKADKLLAETFAPKGVDCGADQPVTITGSQGKLQGLLRRPVVQAAGGATPVAVLMHGFMGSKEGQMFDLIADSLSRHGIASVRFDFNGHGQSEGKFEEMTVPNEIDDAKAIIDYARSLYGGKVALLGHSQGGVVASMTAGQLEPGSIDAVVLMAPAAVLRDDAIRGNTMGALYDPIYPPETVQLFNGLKLGAGYIKSAAKLKIYETATKYQGPALVIHGTGDRIVPYTYGERFHSIWPSSQLEILNEYDHGFSQDIYRATRLASDWLIQALR